MEYVVESLKRRPHPVFVEMEELQCIIGANGKVEFVWNESSRSEKLLVIILI